jgi:DUF1680 family protein
MKDRTLKELYEMLWGRIKDKSSIFSLCGEIVLLKRSSLINETDYLLLSNHFEDQRYKHPEFMNPKRNWNNQMSEPFWWKINEDSNPVNRKAFIQKIISTL